MLFPLLITIHVLGVVLWIGGVAFVTLIIFPLITKMEGSLEQVLFFQRVEHRFGKIAKLCVLIVGLTGVWLLYLTGQWRQLFTFQGIGPTVMLLVWGFYVLVLLFEKWLFQVIFSKQKQQDTKKVFHQLTVFHWVVLVLSLLATGIGVWTGHGGQIG
jgi:uncharacterized membrane protein